MEQQQQLQSSSRRAHQDMRLAQQKLDESAGVARSMPGTEDPAQGTVMQVSRSDMPVLPGLQTSSSAGLSTPADPNLPSCAPHLDTPTNVVCVTSSTSVSWPAAASY